MVQKPLHKTGILTDLISFIFYLFGPGSEPLNELSQEFKSLKVLMFKFEILVPRHIL